LKQPVNPTTLQIYGILNAYAKNDSAAFNRDLNELKRTFAQHEQLLVDNRHKLDAASVKQSEVYGQSRVNFEAFFNHFSPFYYAAVLYVVAFVLGAASWLGWSVPLRRASIWLLCFTLIVHTFALWGRMHISGRPPVTNLYSSAIFIGWGCVVLGLVLEFIYKLGLGNIVAAAVGFLTLVVAHFLSLDGDTLIVMQAVLDTQFWLATHVVCITLGYATTFIAGAFGICYILLAHVFPVLQENDRRQLTRMIYGSVCFAIFFSFVGTVLGGLWADDSWGRFWGWDPKETWALIALLGYLAVLHGRLIGWFRDFGLAVGSIAGFLLVLMAWYGVNYVLGTGLHAYGFGSGGAGWMLGFTVTEMVIVVLALARRAQLRVPSTSPSAHDPRAVVPS
jgi:ABC-type transport system involved in cytochrome c biogenesis permease subunit